jgi:kynureninase
MSLVVTDPRHAAALDAHDPLAAFRDRFAVRDPALVYLDGNSLGRLPKDTAAHVARVVSEEWGGELVRGWGHWFSLPGRVGDRIAALVGARPGEVIAADSTTVNLFKLANAALDARPGRRVVVIDRDDFPTDRYVLEGIAAARGLSIRWVESDPVAGPTPADVAAALDDDVALVTLSHVHYRSGAIADMTGITRLAHERGALAAWDLSHSAGVVPVDLEGAGADLAVGCTYKYLDGGPGAPAYLYVREALHGQLTSPIWGWFGRRDPLAMAQGYEPQAGIGRWLTGTPSVVALAAVESGVALVAEAGIGRIRDKAIALGDYAVALFDAWLAPLGCVLGSPRDPSARGSHVSIRHPGAAALCEALIAARVVPDFRAPDSIRFGMSPLTTSFRDVHRGLDHLRALLIGGMGASGRFAIPDT